ncbi:hypothetical protein [Hyphomicrobium sp. LHD-15]|uniref:hypothetical protein n=1 Tax=Hyphomicrobium sp. LHD-15 TaxID=3072142 RepID=UPI00280CCF81|nr:hypothetical protein [Hyphomicrobium sp. LHD-15]MDQ8700214.1 hypothetical protein [Hyphomicrobium sp. LHD-15]
MVHFANHISPDQLPTAFRALMQIVPWSVWEKRIGELRPLMNRLPAWEQYLRERHGLEFALADSREYLRNTGRWPWPPRTADEYRLAAFITVLVRTFGNVSDPAKRRLAGSIRSALEKDSGLGPLALEMKATGLAMRSGFDVTFHDLENGGGFDLLAQKGSSQIEIECKHISADIGRQIHRRKVYELGDRLQGFLSNLLDKFDGGMLVRINIPGRLTGNPQQQSAIVRNVMSAAGGQPVSDDTCEAQIERFSLENSPFSGVSGHLSTLEDVQNFTARRFNLDNAHILTHWRPGKAAVVVHIASATPDSVIDRLFKHMIDDTKHQLSGTRPGCLCVHLADLSPEQLRDLARAEKLGEVTGIRRAISALLNRRSHLHTVALLTDGDVNFYQTRIGSKRVTEVVETGPSYVFYNPDHPSANDPALKHLFGGNS